MSVMTIMMIISFIMFNNDIDHHDVDLGCDYHFAYDNTRMIPLDHNHDTHLDHYHDDHIDNNHADCLIHEMMIIVIIIMTQST